MFFVIDGDKPIYQLFLIQPQRQIKQLFFLHASLDTVQSLMPEKKQFFFGTLTNQQVPIYCFVNCTSTKLMLMFNRDFKTILSEKKAESNIKDFFTKANQNLAQLFLNPLYKLHQQIKIASFDERIRQLAKQYIKPIIQKQKKK